MGNVVNGAWTRWVRSSLRGAGRHAVFLVAVVVAVVVRWIAALGYPGVLWFGDSRTYLASAVLHRPSDVRPSGYPVFLWLLESRHSFLWVVGLQHAMGVAIGVMVYALVWRGARNAWPQWPWPPGVAGTACALPALLDAYQIQLEHLLMADTLFTFLLAAGVTVVMWRRRMTWWTGALTGLLVSLAALTRSVGLPLLLVLLVAMSARRAGRRAIAAALAAFAVPVLIYMSWFRSHYGEFALTRTDQIWLYGRTVDFAKCSIIKPRPEVAILCRDDIPPDPNVAPAFAALWKGDSGFNKLPMGIEDPKANELAGEFAWAAIRRQPGEYAGVILRDTFRAFEAERTPYPTPGTFEKYEFRQGASLTERDAVWAYLYGGRTAEARVVEPYGGWMRDYQSIVHVPGPLLGAMLAVGLIGLLARARRLGGHVLLPWSVSLALLVVPAATADFDYRYVVPAVPFAALAAGLALIPESRRAVASPERQEEGKEAERAVAGSSAS